MTPGISPSDLSAPALKRCFSLRLANLRQHFLCFSGLPLCIVETLARLAEIHLGETALRILDCPQGEVQPLTRFAQAVELRLFRDPGGKPDCVHYCNLPRRFSFGNKRFCLKSL